MMRDEILSFAEQFSYEPVIENESRLVRKERAVIAGMGGSALPGEFLRLFEPHYPLTVHRGYGLPPRADGDMFLIASSYSGNTEETIDSFVSAKGAGITRAAISTGGKLLELAKEDNVSYIQLPATNIQPRMALGFSMRAVLKLLGHDELLQKTGVLSKTLQPAAFEEEGRALAVRLKGRVPVIYASSANFALAYDWKITFNETGKIPAFYNVFSELNHNEMTGFDRKAGTRTLSDVFAFIFLKDEADHPRIQKRMDILRALYETRGLPVETRMLKGAPFLKIFSSLVLADWAAYYTAAGYGAEPEKVPMVEEFKGEMK